jgi:hypothetical protein
MAVKEWRYLSLVAVGNGLVAVKTVQDESFKVIRVLYTLNKALTQEVFEIPEPLGETDKSNPLLLEEVCESTQVVLEGLVVEVPADVELTQVAYVPQHLHKLDVLDKLLVQLVGLLSIIRNHLSLLAAQLLTFRFELASLRPRR